MRLLGLVLMTTLSMSLAACSPESGSGAQRADQGSRAGTQHRETASPSEPESAGEGQTAAPSDTSVSWDYVALGDSLAAGVGARHGYVDRYAEHLRTDTGARVRVLNLGQPGQTSPGLLRALRNDPSMRRALGGAEVVTFNIGINDLGMAREAYEEGTCGGPYNEECLRVAVREVGENWEAIVGEIMGLRSGRETIILTPGLGYTPRTSAFFAPHVREVNRHIATTASAKGIPHAEVHLGPGGMGPDGLHPNDRGYGVIADRLRGLGYEP